MTGDWENTQMPASAHFARCLLLAQGRQQNPDEDEAVLFERVFAYLSRGGAAPGLRCAGASIAVSCLCLPT
jgi:hypothetical protein